jgi:membrane fusion protein (multidrug efflux system)
VKVILRRSEDALIIPLSAVIDRNGKDIVFIEEDGKAVQVEPVLDIREGDQVSVLKGLSPGQKVIVIGQHNVSTGDKVSITEEIE